MCLPNMVFIHVEEIDDDSVRLRFSINERQQVEKEIFSSEIFNLKAGDSWSVNNIIADFDPSLELKEHL